MNSQQIAMDSDKVHDLSILDAGIRDYVAVLWDAGVETFESCEGGPGHASSEPIVRFFGESGEGFRALAVALDAKLPVLNLRRFWQIIDGEPCGPYWELSFLTSASRSESRAGDRPYR